jgi:hypothetical protein
MTVLTVVPVKVTAKRADGTPIANAKVRFTLTVPDTDGQLVVPTRYAGVTDVNGEATLNVWPNTRGVNGSQYRVEITGEGLAFNGLATVPEYACNLHEILTLQPGTVSDGLAAVVLSRAWATKLGGPVADGEFSAKKHALDAGFFAGQAATVQQRIYPVAYAADPATRPDGSPIQDGDVYVSTTGVVKIHAAGAWAVMFSIDAAALANASNVNLGAALVGFFQGGPGAAASNLMAAVRREVWLENFGARNDGTNPAGVNDVAMTNALTYLNSLGGGILRIGPGTFRFDATIVPVMTAGAIQTVKPLHFLGSGCHWSGNGLPINGGTIFDLRGGDANGKIRCNGSGIFSAEGITFTNIGPADTFPFIKTTNTALQIRRNAFMGHISRAGITCDQDAIVLGGSSVPNGNDPDAPFQGYGTVIENNFFDRIRRKVHLRNWCNGSVIRSNTGWTRCGSNLVGGAAYHIEGDPSGSNTNVGNTIESNLMEVGFYPYGIKVERAGQNVIAFNSCYDPTGVHLAAVRYEATASNNLTITTFGAPGNYISDAGVNNRVISMTDDVSKLPALAVQGLTANNVAMQPTSTGVNGVAPVGAMTSGVIWYLLSGTADVNPDGGGVRFQWRADGSMTLGGNGSGNVTNNLVTGAGQWNNGRYRGFNRSTGANMGIDTGSGGSFWDVIAFAERHYDHGNNLRYTVKNTAQGMELDSDLAITTVGKGIRIKEGANARMGVAVLVGGTVTVANTSITATTRISLTIQSLGTVAVPKAIGVTARVNGTSFTITSADATDTSVVFWELKEPAI